MEKTRQNIPNLNGSRRPTCSCTSHHGLDLNLRHGRTGTSKIRSSSLGVLGVIIRNGGFDRILGEHRTMHYPSPQKRKISTHPSVYPNLSQKTPTTQKKRKGRERKRKEKLTLNRRQTQLPRNLRIPHFPRILQRHPPHKLRQITTTRDGAPASKRLELDILDALRFGVDAYLEFHYVAAGGGADEAGADCGVGFGHGTDVARGGVVVEDFFVVGTTEGLGG